MCVATQEHRCCHEYKHAREDQLHAAGMGVHGWYSDSRMQDGCRGNVGGMSVAALQIEVMPAALSVAKTSTRNDFIQVFISSPSLWKCGYPLKSGNSFPQQALLRAT
jgi:hypothetical protein